MQTHTHTHPYFRLRGLTLALAASGLLLSPASHAQLSTDVNSSLLQESALSAVLAARRMSTEMQLYSLAQELIAQASDVDQQINPAAANNGLKVAPSSSGAYGQVRRKKNTQATLLALPSSTSNQRDSNGIPIGYCRFDPPQGSQSSAAIAFAIISAGNDGNFDTDCDTLRNPSSPVNSDDIAVRVTFEQMSLAGTQASNFGATVDSYSELTGLKARIDGGSVTARQVRLVKTLNQLFVAAVDASGNVNWSPLTPTAFLSNGSENRADFRWMSGAIGIGANSISGRPATSQADSLGIGDASSRSTLTLGNVSSNAAGTVLADNRAVGISLLDDNSALRTYVGLSGTGQTAFSIRHTNAQGTVNERLRISSDGRLWLGDVPLNETPSLPAGSVQSVSSIFAGSMQLATGTFDPINGARIGRTIYIGDTMAGQNAFMRAMESNSGSGLLPVLTLGMQNASTGLTGSGHILFNTNGNVGIGFDGLSVASIPAAKLDVNGNALFRGQAEIRSSDQKMLYLRGQNGAPPEIFFDGRSRGDDIQTASIGMAEYERGLLFRVNNRDQIFIRPKEPNNPGNLEFKADFFSDIFGLQKLYVIGLDPKSGYTSRYPDGEPILVVGGASQLEGALQVSGNVTANSAVSVGGLVTANNGLNVNNAALNANAGLNSTTGFFSGAVGILTNTVGEGLALDVNGKARITNALGIGTLPANDRALDVAGNANISGTLGVGGRLTASGGLSTTTGTFSDVLAANGGLGATSGTFSQLLRADGGLTVTGNTSAQSATFTHLTADTGSFKQSLNTDGNMTVGGNLSVAGLASLNGGLNVAGNSTFNGTLTVNGKIAGLNTVAMQFFGYSGPNNSNPTPIGNATLDINTGAVQIFLAQANPNLYNIDQNLSSGNTPTFSGMRLDSGGLSSSGVISTSSSFQGYLDGSARDANKLNTTLRLRFFQNAGEGPYSIAEFDLREGHGLMERDIVVNATPIINYNSNNTIDNADHRSVNVTTGAVQFSNFTINCTVQGGNSSSTNCVVPNFNASVTAQADSNSFLQGNNYSNQLSGNTFNASPITQYQVTNQISGTSASANFATTAGTANQLASPVNLRLKGDFINDASVSFQSGGVVDLTLFSKGLTYAKNMNQDVKTDSTVTFNQLTAAQARINGDISANSIQVQGPATVRSLSVVNSGGSTNIRLDGETSSARIGNITLNGSDSSVTATRFIGTADKATRLEQDLTFSFQGVISGTASTSNGFNYTINTSIGQGTITNDMIKELHGSKLTGLSVDTAQLATGAVKTDKILDGAVTADKLGTDAVITDKIKNEAVTTNKLAPDAVIFKARNLESSSDIRLKHTISRIDGNSLLQRLSQTLLYGYQFNSDPEQKRQLGVIAQELQPLFPELVTVQKDGPDAGFFAVNYGVLGAVAAAGVGELNRKLDALGIRIKNATTVEASLPTFAVTRIEGVNARFEKLDADEITAKTARFEKLDAQQFVTDKSRSKQLQADTLNSGSTEGFGMGGGLMLFSAVQDGHYLVQVSAADGSHATASVFVSGGVVSVVPVGGSDISIAAAAGTVYAVGPGKHMKASWLKTG